jgi:hypothetical protein
VRALVELTGWKIIAHNRYWSPYTNYAKANGGEWDFFIDAPLTGNDMAVPLEQAFWVWLLKDSVKVWGLTTYEQDWLHDEVSFFRGDRLNFNPLPPISLAPTAGRRHGTVDQPNPRPHLDAADGLRC